MALLLNIENLLNKQKIESNRIEFKKGWNPVTTYHSICAFANDFEDLGGGYIIVGVDTDENGVAKRPVVGVPEEQIDVVVHRESMIHSLVEFRDGSVLAQLSPPDMRLPIQLALTYPERYECPVDGLDLTAQPLVFSHPDLESFPCLRLAMDAAKQGGTACPVMNGANEAAVALFPEDKIGFYDIYELVSGAMEAIPFIADPTLEEILACDAAARAYVRDHA